LERGYTVDVTYTSVLKRAIRSSWIILKELGQIYRPAIKSWRLNERMYGALEGLSKPELVVAFDEKTVQQWRSGLVERPPPMTETHVHWHRSDEKYRSLDPSLIPITESLQDTIDRTLPLWESHIVPDLKAGRNVMIVAHANSLRGIVKHVDGLGTQAIQKIGIPNAIPLVYKFDHNMRPIAQEKAIPPLSGVFLEKKDVLRQALLREEEHYKTVQVDVSLTKPTFFNASTIDDGIEKSTSEEQQRKLMNLFAEHNLVNNNQAIATHGRLALSGVKCGPDEDYLRQVVKFGGGGGGGGGSVSLLTGQIEKQNAESIGSLSYSTKVDSDSIDENAGFTSDDLKNSQNPLLIIIRHGKTEHNKLRLFTGWEDAPLAEEGRDEAFRAGQLLLSHKIKVDFVYTSWLSRAIETAWSVVNELDILWVPIVKTWRLNERMYGALTGYSKKMIKQKYGEEQFLLWRRGFDIRPPPVSSFSPFYPGNDDRYVNYVADIKVSYFETIIRSLAHGRLEVHRDFPKTESLQDCMERTLPYFTDEILPRVVKEKKNVLVASSENAIRGLLMHLCDIPRDQINKVEIPTGLPLVFDWRAKRVRIFDDGVHGRDILKRYDFGAGMGLLFGAGVGGKTVADGGVQSKDVIMRGEETDLQGETTNQEGLYIYDPIIWKPRQ